MSVLLLHIDYGFFSLKIVPKNSFQFRIYDESQVRINNYLSNETDSLYSRRLNWSKKILPMFSWNVIYHF